MPLTRIYEEADLPPELRRIYADVRASFDLPWVPTVFKLAAGVPEYIKLMWDDLGHVARSPEFQAAASALAEYVRSLAVSDGWQFSDQERVLSTQKFSLSDIEQLGAMLALFARNFPKLVLFVRLMQRGYSGGQRGRSSSGRQASALAHMITLNVPNDKEAGLRTWLIYNDIKKTTGSRTVFSIFRVISLFPGYLASVWMESKKLLAQPAFMQASGEVSRRSLGLIYGMPVKDHRKLSRGITQEQWRDIEEMVDGFARLLPQFSLLASVWQRSFPHHGGRLIAA